MGVVRLRPQGRWRDGFTLVEMTIVVVIIGMVVGAVLVGRDMLDAAGARATVGQLGEYSVAVHTFRERYEGVPGDLQFAQASAFGLFAFTGVNAGDTGMGDGNGLVENVNPTDGSPIAVGEPLALFRHLSETNLIDGSFGRSGNSAIVSATGLPTGMVTDVAQSLPRARLGRGNHIAAYAYEGKNVFEVNGVAAIATDGHYTAPTPQLTPNECERMDSKMDDGLPNTGHVVARGAAIAGALNQAPAVGAGACVGGLDPGDGYMLVGGVPACALRVGLQ